MFVHTQNHNGVYGTDGLVPQIEEWGGWASGTIKGLLHMCGTCRCIMAVS